MLATAIIDACASASRAPVEPGSVRIIAISADKRPFRTPLITTFLYRDSELITSAHADSTGTLRLPNVPPGRYRLVTSTIRGFIDDTGVVKVRSGRTTEYRATLRQDLSLCQGRRRRGFQGRSSLHLHVTEIILPLVSIGRACTAATNVGIALGLLVFAGLQWKVTERQATLQAKAEAARRTELANEIERQRDVAYRVIWAEWFRLRAVATRWRERGILVLASSGTLRAEDVLPRDWGLLTEQLGRLSREASHIGSVGLTLAFDAAQEAALVAETFRVMRMAPGYSATGAVAAVLRVSSPNTEGLQRSADGALQMAENASATLEEALKISPNSDKALAFAIPKDSLSDVGRWLKRMANERSTSGSSSSRK